MLNCIGVKCTWFHLSVLVYTSKWKKLPIVVQERINWVCKEVHKVEIGEKFMYIIYHRSDWLSRGINAQIYCRSHFLSQS